MFFIWVIKNANIIGNENWFDSLELNIVYQFNIMEYDLVQVWIFCLAYQFYLGEILLFLYEPIAMIFLKLKW